MYFKTPMNGRFIAHKWTILILNRTKKSFNVLNFNKLIKMASSLQILTNQFSINLFQTYAYKLSGHRVKKPTEV